MTPLGKAGKIYWYKSLVSSVPDMPTSLAWFTAEPWGLSAVHHCRQMVGQLDRGWQYSIH